MAKNNSKGNGKIIVPATAKPLKKGVTVAVTKTYLDLRCGKCSHQRWRVVVHPFAGMGKVVAVVCGKCDHTIQIDDLSTMQGQGKIDVFKKSPREWDIAFDD